MQQQHDLDVRDDICKVEPHGDEAVERGTEDADHAAAHERMHAVPTPRGGIEALCLDELGRKRPPALQRAVHEAVTELLSLLELGCDRIRGR